MVLVPEKMGGEIKVHLESFFFPLSIFLNYLPYRKHVLFL